MGAYKVFPDVASAEAFIARINNIGLQRGEPAVSVHRYGGARVTPETTSLTDYEIVDREVRVAVSRIMDFYHGRTVDSNTIDTRTNRIGDPSGRDPSVIEEEDSVTRTREESSVTRTR